MKNQINEKINSEQVELCRNDKCIKNNTCVRYVNTNTTEELLTTFNEINCKYFKEA